MTPEELFELVVYLVASSRLTIDEGPLHGSFRLVEGAARLIDAVGTDDPFLRERREEIEREKVHTMDDQPRYEAWLTRLARDLAVEAARRNAAAPA